MLDTRPTAYVAPLREEPLGPLLPVITVKNFGDEPATLTGLVRIYRISTGYMLYSSVLHPDSLTPGEEKNISAETAFLPGAPGDDEYQITVTTYATSTTTGRTQHGFLGAFVFSITAPPPGPYPKPHAPTHEDAGCDELNIAGLHGELADPQPPMYNTPQSLFDAPHISWDLSLGGFADVMLGGDRELDNPTNLVAGTALQLKVQQDATGTRVLTYGTAFKFPGGVPPTLSTAIFAVDILEFLCDGLSLFCVSFTADLK